MPSVREQLEKKYGKPAQSPAQPDKNLIQKFGDASASVLEPASNLLFGTAKKTIGTAIAAPIMEMQGRHDEAQQLVKENVTPGNIAFTALELYPGGGFVTKALKKVPGGEAIARMITEHVPEGLREQAIKQYSEALGATTNELKAKTAKVVPELINRGVTGGLDKIKGLAESGIDEAGMAVNAAEEAIPSTAKTATKVVIEQAKKLRNSYIIDGQVFDESAVKAIDSSIKKITKYGHEIPDKSLLQMKRLLDESVRNANKNFTKSDGLSLATKAQESMANAIRKTLNSNHVDLGMANKEFSLWKDVNKIVTATVERRSSQSGGLTKYIVPAISGGAGFAAGNPVNAAIAYFTTQGAIKLLTSPAYKTVSAVTKDRLANYIASGKLKEATLLTNKILNAIKNASSQ